MKTLISSTNMTRRVLIGFAAIAAAIGFTALPASATITGVATASPVGLGPGYTGVLPTPLNGTTSVISDTISVNGGTPIVAYCLDSTLGYVSDTSAVYTATTQTAAGETNVAEAADVAANSASIGTPLSDPDAEAVAIQLAIWNLTDNFDFSTVANTSIVARANALVAGATPLTQGLLGGNLTATTAQSVSTDTVTATLLDPSANPIVGQTLNFSGPSGTTTAVTGPDGTATVSFPAAAGTENITWDGTLPAGTIFAPPTSGQNIVTSAPTPINSSASVTTDAAPATTPPTTTPPVTTPTTPPVATGTATPPASPPAVATSTTPAATALPFTGTWIHPYYLVLALIIAASAILLRRRLRRRAHA